MMIGTCISVRRCASCGPKAPPRGVAEDPQARSSEPRGRSEGEPRETHRHSSTAPAGRSGVLPYDPSPRSSWDASQQKLVRALGSGGKGSSRSTQTRRGLEDGIPELGERKLDGCRPPARKQDSRKRSDPLRGGSKRG